MAVCRVEHTKDYTVMSNWHLKDSNLTLKAKGLLSYILSLPDDWDYTIEGLAYKLKEGRKAIGSALDELEACGYLQRRQCHAERGQFGGNEYIFFEYPPGAEMPEPLPLAQNVLTVEDAPLAQNVLTENPSADNGTQLSTNIPSTNIPPKAPQRGRQREAKTVPEWKPERFSGLWSCYPRGEAKQRAIAAWDKLRPDDKLIAVMGRALKVQMCSDAWQQGIGIPYLSTWLNGRRWEDEHKGAPAAAAERSVMREWT